MTLIQRLIQANVKLPRGKKFIAQDENGDVYAYEEYPEVSPCGMWFMLSAGAVFVAKGVKIDGAWMGSVFPIWHWEFHKNPSEWTILAPNEVPTRAFGKGVKCLQRDGGILISKGDDVRWWEQGKGSDVMAYSIIADSTNQTTKEETNTMTQQTKIESLLMAYMTAKTEVEMNLSRIAFHETLATSALDSLKTMFADYGLRILPAGEESEPKQTELIEIHRRGMKIGDVVEFVGCTGDEDISDTYYVYVVGKEYTVVKDQYNDIGPRAESGEVPSNDYMDDHYRFGIRR